VLCTKHRIGITLSSDFISGFCGETDEDHQETISLLKAVEFDEAFMFAYSEREKTPAHRRLKWVNCSSFSHLLGMTLAQPQNSADCKRLLTLSILFWQGRMNEKLGPITWYS
jgi:hypothetical protein